MSETIIERSPKHEQYVTVSGDAAALIAADLIFLKVECTMDGVFLWASAANTFEQFSVYLGEEHSLEYFAQRFADVTINNIPGRKEPTSVTFNMPESLCRLIMSGFISYTVVVTGDRQHAYCTVLMAGVNTVGLVGQRLRPSHAVAMYLQNAQTSLFPPSAVVFRGEFYSIHNGTISSKFVMKPGGYSHTLAVGVTPHAFINSRRIGFTSVSDKGEIQGEFNDPGVFTETTGNHFSLRAQYAASLSAGVLDRTMSEAMIRQYELMYVTKGGVKNSVPDKCLSVWDVLRGSLVLQARAHHVAVALGEESILGRINGMSQDELFVEGAKTLFDWWDMAQWYQRFQLLSHAKKCGPPRDLFDPYGKPPSATQSQIDALEKLLFPLPGHEDVAVQDFDESTDTESICYYDDLEAPLPGGWN